MLMMIGVLGRVDYNGHFAPIENIEQHSAQTVERSLRLPARTAGRGLQFSTKVFGALEPPSRPQMTSE